MTGGKFTACRRGKIFITKRTPPTHPSYLNNLVVIVATGKQEGFKWKAEKTSPFLWNPVETSCNLHGRNSFPVIAKCKDESRAPQPTNISNRRCRRAGPTLLQRLPNRHSRKLRGFVGCDWQQQEVNIRDWYFGLKTRCGLQCNGNPCFHHYLFFSEETDDDTCG